MTELRNVEADLSRFRARVLVASLAVLICFVLLALNNFLVVADLVLLPAVDLRVERLALNLIAVAILLYGFIWELD